MSCTGQSELIYVCLKIKLSASKGKSKFNIAIVLITEFTDAVGQNYLNQKLLTVFVV